MNIKLEKALSRLEHILPLKKRQGECCDEIHILHQQILHSFVASGHILSRDEMASCVDDLEAAIQVLQSRDLVIFSAAGEPLGAYPFTMEPRPHKILINGHQIHAMCALDSLAASPMFGLKARIDSQCRVTGDTICIQQSDQRIENREEADDIHVGIDWGSARHDDHCANNLCMDMIFLRNHAICRQWLIERPQNREVFTLREAIEFASRFFVPLVKTTDLPSRSSSATVGINCIHLPGR